MKKKNRIKILHFNNFKPWKINHKSPHKSLYRKYRRKIDKLFFYDDLSIKNIYKNLFLLNFIKHKFLSNLLTLNELFIR